GDSITSSTRIRFSVHHPGKWRIGQGCVPERRVIEIDCLAQPKGEHSMKAIALGAFGAALLASAASAAPLNATTIGSTDVSYVGQVRLVCNLYYGRCWRIWAPRYVRRYYFDDPSYVVGRGYN